jgi:hypothetical protein
MKKSKSLILSELKSIDLLINKKDMARRGLSDFQNMNLIEDLKDEMVLLYKNEQFKECIKICRRIINKGGGGPFINLILSASLKRLK